MTGQDSRIVLGSLERALGVARIEQLKESEKTMMGLLKDFTKEIQSKPWVLLGRKTSEPAPKSTGEVETGKVTKSFCDAAADTACVTVCAPRSGCECGSDEVRRTLEEEIAKQGLSITLGNAKVGCDGKCKKGALLGFPQKGFFYTNVKPQDVPLIVKETLARGRLLFPHLSLNPDRSYRNDIIFERETGMLAGIDDRICMVEVAKYFLDFEEGLSCGKCVPCRIGLKRIQEYIKKIVTGTGTPEDIEQIRSLCKTMIGTPHCDFAMASSRPVLSALTLFADEFRTHVENQVCPAGVCKDLVEIQRKRAIRERLSGKKKK